ncbi:hypothetical protein M422DRAFT_243865 [Sphaerobolus stellatus SS14]|nr:hypothetical protein M422DRAFT_243865 [Sphaerobolus stellatus SS14]
MITLKSLTTSIALHFISGRLYDGCVQAQFSPNMNDNCTAGWEWTYNLQGKTPCQIAATLTSNCDLNFEVTGVPRGYPTDPKGQCLCNTAIYSLIYACNTCQNQAASPPITWGKWLDLNNCTTSTPGPVRPSITTTALHSPIPSGVDVVVPGWAYESISESDFWQSTFVRPMAENTPLINVTITGLSDHKPTLTPSITLPGGTSSPMTTSASQSATRSNIGTIVGGVIGGVAVLGIFFLGAVLLIRNRAIRARQARHPGASLDPFNLPPKEERWQASHSNEDSSSTYSNKIPMHPFIERPVITPSLLSRNAAIPPIPPLPPISASEYPSTQKYDARSILSRSSALSRNPFFQIAAVEGSLTQEQIERHTKNPSQPQSNEQFGSLI